ncbi:MAG: hypothetical protein HGA96_04880 [Desulfobulbaceae bacterium]|nr:hypothetical protein [Desulfobulbaceae bacterium]
MTEIPGYTNYFELQADAFLQGQTSLLIKPAPELLQTANPYGRENAPLWLWDAVLFQGRYYLYWGPVPPLFIAAVKALTPIKSLPDQYPCLVFAMLRLVATLTILWQVWRLLGIKRFWPLTVCGLVMAWANPFPFLLGRAAMYETAILAGQAFSFAGLSLSLSAFTTDKRRHKLVALFGAGCLWTLAFGSRLSLLPALAFVALITAAAIATRLAQSWRQGFAVALPALAAPMLAGLVLLGWYNWLRFGDPFETGQYYQLGMLTLTKTMNLGYVTINSYLYLLKPPVLIGQFPFVTTPEYPLPTIPWFVSKPPEPYNLREPIAGIIWTIPFVVLAIPACRYVWAKRDLLSNPVSSTAPCETRDLVIGWLICSSLGFTLLAAAPLLCFWMATMRYTADFTTSLVLLACLGSLLLHQQILTPGRQKILLNSLIISLMLTTIVVGFLLWTESEGEFLRTFNPELMQRFIEIFRIRQ